MGSDDGPVLIGSVLSAMALAARLAFDAAGWILGANLRVGKWFWRQAHFLLGALIAYFGGVALAVFLDVSPLATVAMVSTLGWALFCPTEDLVWMRQRGYVSPAYVRFALLALASRVGVTDAADYDAAHAAEEEELAKLREETAKPAPDAAKPRDEWTADAAPAADADDERRRSRSRSRNDHPPPPDPPDVSARKRRLEYLERRAEYHRVRARALYPLRLGVRALLRWQGLIRKEDEERIALEAERRAAAAFGASGGAADEKRRVGPPRRALPHPATWPHRPVFVRFSPRDGGKQKPLAGWATRWGPETGGVADGKTPPSAVDASCPVNTETCMSFESELFVGEIICRFKGIGCPANPSAVKTKEEFFRQKRCTFQVLVQGRFKEEVRADQILTGGEFSKPFTDRPPTYLVSAGCKFFAHLTPGLELDLLCDEPYYVATLGGTVTTLRADAPGDAPDPASDVSENNARMGGEFATAGPAGASVSRRCRVLGDPKTASAYVYNTEDVYTFDYFQSVLLFDSYCLDIGIVKLKLDRHVNGQPLGIMAKHADGRYVYNFEIFHECLLPKSDQAPPGTR